MNWKRFRYFLGCLFFLGLSLLLAYGQVEAPDPLVSELAVLFVVTVFLAYLVGRDSDNEDETAGIISLDDDD